ncbi:NERD domain-containing protein [Sulfurimonas sp. HSL1-6]|uniref:NERD domain-containing protein n=1 Tax=Thiomicrolovo immobilis TaxID=3131935 RepID=UPI0031F88EE2
MPKKDKFETLRSNITKLDVERTLGFFQKCSKIEQVIILHDIKRNQLFNIRTPDDLPKKLSFISELNRKINQVPIISELRLYFEFFESIFSAMNVFYQEFNLFYTYLEKENQTQLFLVYVFTYYSILMSEIESYVEKENEKWKSNKLFDSTLAIAIPSKDGHATDVDTQIEFIAEFLKTNIMFYKYKSKIESLQIIQVDTATKEINEDLKNIFETDLNSMIQSFNSWRNGIELIDLINLFDWQIHKKTSNQLTTYSIQPKAHTMNEYINQEFGLFIYLHFKHSSTRVKYIESIRLSIQNEDFEQVVKEEYLYIKEIFENEYYIDHNIFMEKYNQLSLEAYVKFYLLFKVYFSYFLHRAERQPVFIVNWDFIANLFIQHIELFADQMDIKNKKKLKELLDTCLDFYTNNGEDLFNYPFIKYDFMRYAIPNTIISANSPRLFIERFSKIISAKKKDNKGYMLEKHLLFNEEILFNRGIKIIKNIDLKLKNQKVGEIDILLFDGQNILIAELKNQRTFNNQKEMYNRKKDLKRTAVTQIKKAKKFLLTHQKEMSNKLNIDIKNADNIIPIVITPLDELNNIVLDNTLVVSSFIVKIYFENDHFAVREFGLNHDIIIEREYFNKKRITLNEFIAFVKENKAIKLLKYFKDKRINTVEVFEHNKTKYKRIILSQKEALIKKL